MGLGGSPAIWAADSDCRVETLEMPAKLSSAHPDHRCSWNYESDAVSWRPRVFLDEWSRRGDDVLDHQKPLSTGVVSGPDKRFAVGL